MSCDMENRMENNFIASENEREQLFNRIEELEQRVKVLTLVCELAAKEPVGLLKSVATNALNQTPQQTAAQIERGHVEWMMKQPVAGFVREWEGDISDLGNMLFAASEEEKDENPNWVAVVAIPPLQKESSSPETDLDEALRRQ